MLADLAVWLSVSLVSTNQQNKEDRNLGAMKTDTIISSLDKLDGKTRVSTKYQKDEMTGIGVDVQSLCEASLKARLHSYSPYSKFKVGAAIICSDNVTTNTITGCNVENASYGLTVCAERTAVLKAVSEGFTEITSIAIAADLDESFVGPCGMCR